MTTRVRGTRQTHADDTPAVLSQLRGLVHDDILEAPRTAGHASNLGQWPEIPERAVKYLERSVAGSPWIDHLALAAAIESARRLDPSTILVRLSELHSRFRALFPVLGLVSMAEWRPNRHLPAYLRGELLPEHSAAMRASFRSTYCTTARDMQEWAASLSWDQELDYGRFLLPVVESRALAGLASDYLLDIQTRQRRKAETDAVLPHFAELRLQAHLRFNQLARLLQAYREAVSAVTPDRSNLPLAYICDEGGNPASGLPAMERWHFRVWDRRSFVLAHAQAYHHSTVRAARLRKRACFSAHDQLFLEFVRVERLVDDAPPEGAWFAELLRLGLLGDAPSEARRRGYFAQARLDWLREWGYLDRNWDPTGVSHGPGRSGKTTVPFRSSVPGLFSFARHGSASFTMVARHHTDGVLVPLEGLYAAAFFGLVALDLFTTTGMRMNEAMQTQLSSTAFVKQTRPVPPGARDQTPRMRWLFRLIPKGQREDKPSDFYLGVETVRLVGKLAAWLFTDHYGLASGDAFPVVPFDPNHGRHHRTGPAPYLFQYHQRHLPAPTIASCLRFLLHGLIFQTREGKPVIIKPHLLRHVFATHAVQVERMPIDVVAALLNQKNLEVTDYYSQPTDSIVANAADSLLARLAAHIDLGASVKRLPSEMQRLFEDARGQIGALADVIGGHCCEAGFCPAKFACIGCPLNAVDPAKRWEVRRRIDWLEAQLGEAREHGLMVEVAKFEKQLRDCHTQLREMDLIEQYREDEQRGTFITLGDIATG